MLSFQIPADISISVAPGFIKLQGPKGTFIKKVGDIKFNVFTTDTGTRLFIEGASKTEEASALSHRQQLVTGVSRGFRKRLRLVGIGFRATVRDVSLDEVKGSVKDSSLPTFKRKNYLQKRKASAQKDDTSKKSKSLFLKIGYSHEAAYPLGLKNEETTSTVDVQVSRLEGRSKGSLVCISGHDLTQVNQRANEIRGERRPDVYKGKGIHYDREVIVLKKGKRQS